MTEEKPSMDSEAMSGRITVDAEKQSLAKFLEMWKPSMELAPRVQWISVRKPGARDLKSGDVDGLMEAWEDLCHTKKDAVTGTDVKRLAREYNVLSGKWMIHVSTPEADESWSLVANAVMEGKLGHSAKVILPLKRLGPTLRKASNGKGPIRTTTSSVYTLATLRTRRPFLI